MESIRVFAPASVANVSCGFDILGFALNSPGDEIILNKNNSGEVKIIEITGDEGKLPKDQEKNSASAVIKNLSTLVRIIQHVRPSERIIRTTKFILPIFL